MCSCARRFSSDGIPAESWQEPYTDEVTMHTAIVVDSGLVTVLAEPVSVLPSREQVVGEMGGESLIMVCNWCDPSALFKMFGVCAAAGQ